jgi:hypothetical protein
MCTINKPALVIMDSIQRYFREICESPNIPAVIGAKNTIISKHSPSFVDFTEVAATPGCNVRWDNLREGELNLETEQNQAGTYSAKVLGQTTQ